MAFAQNKFKLTNEEQLRRIPVRSDGTVDVSMKQDNLIAIDSKQRLPHLFPDTGTSDDILFVAHKAGKANYGFASKIGHNSEKLIFQDYKGGVWCVSQIHRWYELP